MLDDNQSEDHPNHGNGSLDKARYDWLINELDKGQAEGKLYDHRSSRTDRLRTILVPTGDQLLMYGMLPQTEYRT